jgi:hypothetical protein
MARNAGAREPMVVTTEDLILGILSMRKNLPNLKLVTPSGRLSSDSEVRKAGKAEVSRPFP